MARPSAKRSQTRCSTQVSSNAMFASGSRAVSASSSAEDSTRPDENVEQRLKEYGGESLDSVGVAEVLRCEHMSSQGLEGFVEQKAGEEDQSGAGNRQGKIGGSRKGDALRERRRLIRSTGGGCSLPNEPRRDSQEAGCARASASRFVHSGNRLTSTLALQALTVGGCEVAVVAFCPNRTGCLLVLPKPNYLTQM